MAGIDIAAASNGMVRGVRLGMQIRDYKDRKAQQSELMEQQRVDRQRQMDWEDQSRGMQITQFENNQEDRERKIGMEEELHSAKMTESYYRNMLNQQEFNDNQLESLSRVYSSIGTLMNGGSEEQQQGLQEYISGPLAEDFNVLFGDSMNQAGPGNLDQRFENINFDEEGGMTVDLRNTDKETGESYVAPMTVDRAQGSKRQAYMTPGQTYGLMKAIVGKANDLGFSANSISDALSPASEEERGSLPADANFAKSIYRTWKNEDGTPRFKSEEEAFNYVKNNRDRTRHIMDYLDTARKAMSEFDQVDIEAGDVPGWLRPELYNSDPDAWAQAVMEDGSSYFDSITQQQRTGMNLGASSGGGNSGQLSEGSEATIQKIMEANPDKDREWAIAYGQHIGKL